MDEFVGGFFLLHSQSLETKEEITLVLDIKSGYLSID